jgi:hypothetical protein
LVGDLVDDLLAVSGLSRLKLEEIPEGVYQSDALR